MQHAPHTVFVTDIEPYEGPPVIAPRMGEAAVADLPKAVGGLIVASYAAIIVAFGWAFFGQGDVLFNLGVCAVYLAMYLGVPWVFLKVEPKSGQPRPDFADFLERGLATWTGHVTGREALAQILTIPVAVAFAALGIGIIIRMSV